MLGLVCLFLIGVVCAVRGRRGLGEGLRALYLWRAFTPLEEKQRYARTETSPPYWNAFSGSFFLAAAGVLCMLLAAEGIEQRLFSPPHRSAASAKPAGSGVKSNTPPQRPS